MKFLSSLILILVVSAVESRRPYTTPSPFGSYRLKLLKCSCNEQMNNYIYSNFTCYAKAVSRDVTTANVYGVVKRDLSKIWITANVDYKYGTIYRTVINFKKIEVCEIINRVLETDNAGNNPMHQLLYKYGLIYAKKYNLERLWHKCPIKAGEYLDAYNITFDTEYMPSLINQGDYRATLTTFIDSPDNLVCNNTVYASIISPIKESFGRK